MLGQPTLDFLARVLPGAFDPYAGFAKPGPKGGSLGGIPRAAPSGASHYTMAGVDVPHEGIRSGAALPVMGDGRIPKEFDIVDGVIWPNQRASNKRAAEEAGIKRGIALTKVRQRKTQREMDVREGRDPSKQPLMTTTTAPQQSNTVESKPKRRGKTRVRAGFSPAGPDPRGRGRYVR